VVTVQHVSKIYRLWRKPWHRLAGPLAPAGSGEEFWAVRDVSFRVEPGECLGLVGPNGSGKSTMLQMIAGVLAPTAGRVRCHGRVAALLELGAGFNPEFTGRENVRLSSEIMGLTRREVDVCFPAIEEFAGIGTFIDRPVKEYSSGMYLRLAFSTAIHVEPDVLIVDEALAVGDAIFANRCVRKFEEIRTRGVTVVFVSHDLGLVKRLCDRAILMWNGQAVCEGEPSHVVNHYVGRVLERQQADTPAGETALHGSHRHGDGVSRIESVDILSAEGRCVQTVLGGQPVRLRVRARYLRDCLKPMLGVLLRTRLGVEVFGTNTKVEGRELEAMRAGEVLEVDFVFPCLLAGQDYTVTAATQHDDGSSQDWVDDAVAFTVINSRLIAGLASLPVEVTWKRA
jgi:ABC-type polysaccharide/polyol phosphate transport system ATPase subunit